jgi:hypothetical protein
MVSTDYLIGQTMLHRHDDFLFWEKHDADHEAGRSDQAASVQNCILVMGRFILADGKDRLRFLGFSHFRTQNRMSLTVFQRPKSGLLPGAAHVVDDGVRVSCNFESDNSA